MASFTKSDELKRHMSWDEYFMVMSHMVKTRSTCLRRAVGAVIIKGNHVIATGYNGAPSGLPHASEVGCIRNDRNIPSGHQVHICRGSHAEMNAIAHCARHGIAIDGSTLYCTTRPCSICLKLIINSGVKRVIFDEFYDDEIADLLIDESSSMIEFTQLQLRDIRKYEQLLSLFDELVMPIDKV